MTTAWSTPDVSGLATTNNFKNYNWVSWRQFESRLLTPQKSPSFALGHYDLVSVLCHVNGQPQKIITEWAPKGFYIVYTQPSPMLESNDEFALRSYMLGTLIETIREETAPVPVVINPNFYPGQSAPSEWRFEEVLWSALRAPLTGQLMTSPPDEALALLAIDNKDQERFGINLVFHLISNHGVPEFAEERVEYLKEKIQELAHFIPRVPIAYGSASIFCVLLNLENTMEETAFIRDYQTFDPHSDVLFVTSSLELLTGKLRPIKYHGDLIDTIFGPIIEWQRQLNPLRSQWHSISSQLSSYKH